jgi:hypothetical protein
LESRPYEAIRFSAETIQKAVAVCFTGYDGPHNLESSLSIEGGARRPRYRTDAEFFDAYRRATGDALYDRRGGGYVLRVSFHAEPLNYTNVTVDAPTAERECEVFNVFAAAAESLSGARSEQLSELHRTTVPQQTAGPPHSEPPGGQKDIDPWYKRPLGILALGVAIGVLVYAANWAIVHWYSQFP